MSILFVFFSVASLNQLFFSFMTCCFIETIQHTHTTHVYSVVLHLKVKSKQFKNCNFIGTFPMNIYSECIFKFHHFQSNYSVKGDTNQSHFM